MTKVEKSGLARRLTPFLSRLPDGQAAEVGYRRVSPHQEVLEIEEMSVVVNIHQDRRVTLSAAGTSLMPHRINLAKAENEEAVLLQIRGYFSKIRSLSRVLD